jgi:hypothetical protein
MNVEPIGSAVFSDGALMAPIVDIVLVDGQIIMVAHTHGPISAQRLDEVRVHGADGSHICTASVDTDIAEAIPEGDCLTLYIPLVLGSTVGMQTGKVWERVDMNTMGPKS